MDEHAVDLGLERMGEDHFLLESLQGPVEIFGDTHVLRDEGAEPRAQLRRQVHQYKAGAEFVGGRLIWVKLCMAEELMPVTRRKSNSRNRVSGLAANSAFTC